MAYLHVLRVKSTGRSGGSPVGLRWDLSLKKHVPRLPPERRRADRGALLARRTRHSRIRPALQAGKRGGGAQRERRIRAVRFRDVSGDGGRRSARVRRGTRRRAARDGYVSWYLAGCAFSKRLKPAIGQTRDYTPLKPLSFPNFRYRLRSYQYTRTTMRSSWHARRAPCKPLCRARSEPVT